MGVKVYGADWCGDTQRSLKVLERLGVDYEYINVEQDQDAAAWVREQNNGKERKPTIDLGGGRVLSTPDDAELEQAVSEKGGKRQG